MNIKVIFVHFQVKDKSHRHCVSSSFYSVLINGSPSEYIFPYLYILCGESLLQTLLIQAKTQEGFFSYAFFWRVVDSSFTICG